MGNGTVETTADALYGVWRPHLTGPPDAHKSTKTEQHAMKTGDGNKGTTGENAQPGGHATTRAKDAVEFLEPEPGRTPDDGAPEEDAPDGTGRPDATDVLEGDEDLAAMATPAAVAERVRTLKPAGNAPDTRMPPFGHTLIGTALDKALAYSRLDGLFNVEHTEDGRGSIQFYYRPAVGCPDTLLFFNTYADQAGYHIYTKISVRWSDQHPEKNLAVSGIIPDIGDPSLESYAKGRIDALADPLKTLWRAANAHEKLLRIVAGTRPLVNGVPLNGDEG